MFLCNNKIGSLDWLVENKSVLFFEFTLIRRRHGNRCGSRTLAAGGPRKRGGAGLFRAAPGCAGLRRAAPRCVGLRWAALGCVGMRQAAPGCAGLTCAALGGAGWRWAPEAGKLPTLKQKYNQQKQWPNKKNQTKKNLQSITIDMHRNC